MRYLLDTHVLLWWLAGSKNISKKVKRILANVNSDQPLFISSITMWEIAMLVNLERIKLDRPLREWLELATAPPLIQIEEITPAVASTLANFPKSFHRDPADRIIVATALLLEAKLITADKRLQQAKLIETVF